MFDIFYDFFSTALLRCAQKSITFSSPAPFKLRNRATSEPDEEKVAEFGGEKMGTDQQHIKL